MTFTRLVEAIKAITGWETSLFEIMRVSERSNVMSRIFNNREGFGPKEDRVIRRWHAIELYYELSGWDKNGKPTRGKLVDLDLEWLIENNED
jgi:aldehyde:ferredoxin oxidoreductase